MAMHDGSSSEPYCSASQGTQPVVHYWQVCYLECVSLYVSDVSCLQVLAPRLLSSSHCEQVNQHSLHDWQLLSGAALPPLQATPRTL